MEITAAQHFWFSTGVTAVINCLLSLFVSKQPVRSALKKRFIIYALTISWWSTFLFLHSFVKSQSHSFFFCQLLHAGATFIPVMFLHFLYEFFEIRDSTRQFILKGFYAISFLYLLIHVFLPELMYPKLVPKIGFPYYLTPGSFYTSWMIWFFLVTAFAHLILFKEYLGAIGIRRKQLKYFFVANLLGYLGGVGDFLPVYNIFHFPFPYGNYGVILFSIVTAYTIVKYKFFDIEVIVRRTILFAGMFAMTMAIVVLVTAITQNYLNRFLALNQSVSMAIGVMIAMLLYDPARQFLVNLTDRFLFQKKFRLTSIVAQASEAISLIQSLKWLARRIVAFLVTTCRIKQAAVYIRDQNDEHFVRGALRGFAPADYPQEIIAAGHPLVQYLEKNRKPLDVQRFEEEISQGGQGQGQNSSPLLTPEKRRVILETLKMMKGELIVPSFLRRRIDMEGIGKEKDSKPAAEEVTLRNILILGGKKSDEPYSDEEQEIFSSLAQESAIAIENARLYDEAIEKTRELEAINSELGDTNEKLKVTQASLIVAEKNATMVGMAKAIGHEINNPLTSIILPVSKLQGKHLTTCRDLLEKIQDKISEEEKIRFTKLVSDIEHSSQQISRSAYRINAVVHTLTNILKDSKGEMEPLSLLVLCREAMEAVRFSTYEENLTGCDVQIDVGSNLMILGNQEQLLQVFLNLIKNAYEAMDKQKDRRIVISGTADPEDPKMAMIRFVDNGPGIPAEVLPRIWGQGFSTKQIKENSIGAAGQGQGLFVCKHMIESVHKGKINVESQIGKGTTFIMHLPLAEGDF